MTSLIFFCFFINFVILGFFIYNIVVPPRDYIRIIKACEKIEEKTDALNTKIVNHDVQISKINSRISDTFKKIYYNKSDLILRVKPTNPIDTANNKKDIKKTKEMEKRNHLKVIK